MADNLSIRDATHEDPRQGQSRHHFGRDTRVQRYDDRNRSSSAVRSKTEHTHGINLTKAMISGGRQEDQIAAAHGHRRALQILFEHIRCGHPWSGPRHAYIVCMRMYYKCERGRRPAYTHLLGISMCTMQHVQITFDVLHP